MARDTTREAIERAVPMLTGEFASHETVVEGGLRVPTE